MKDESEKTEMPTETRRAASATEEDHVPGPGKGWAWPYDLY